MDSHLMSAAIARKTDIRKACNNCIRAKAACDNNRPCFRCLSHKIADSCANVPRKHNVAKRKRIGENGVETEDQHNDNLQFSLSYMINNSLNSIINNLNNNGTNNYNQAMPQVEGEVNGHSMVNNVINSAIQNLNSRSTSAIISDTISSLNHYNPINQAVGSMSFDSPQPAPKSIASQEVDYESVLQWLQSAATNVPAPMAPTPPSLHPSRSAPATTPNPPPLARSGPQYSFVPPPHEDHAPPYDYSSYSFAPPHPKHIQTPPTQPQHTGQPNLHAAQTQSPSQTPQTPQTPQTSSPSQSILLLNHSPSQSTPNHSPSQIPVPSPQQPTPPQHTPPSPSLSVSQSPSLSEPDSPMLPDPPTSDVPALPTLNITIFTKTNRNTAAAYSYVSNLLKHSPMGTSQNSVNHDAEAQANETHPHNISIPSCSAASLVQTLSLLRQYSAIDMGSPIHIEYTYKSIPLKMQPVGLIEMSGPTLVDCNDAFGQVFGFKTAHELMSQNRPVGDYMLPEGIAISRRTVDLFFSLKTAHLERYQVFLLRNRPARVFLAQHELVGSRHRTVTFLEEYPDFPLCFFADWIKTILPNAVLPPCDRPYCHCKYPDEYLKVV